jgi:hypothetical protein
LLARKLGAFAVQRPGNRSRRLNQRKRRELMGELLEIASWVGTPLGGICAVAFVTAMFFYGRWVLSPPKKAG